MKKLEIATKNGGTSRENVALTCFPQICERNYSNDTEPPAISQCEPTIIITIVIKDS